MCQDLLRGAAELLSPNECFFRLGSLPISRMDTFHFSFWTIPSYLHAQQSRDGTKRRMAEIQGVSSCAPAYALFSGWHSTRHKQMHEHAQLVRRAFLSYLGEDQDGVLHKEMQLTASATNEKRKTGQQRASHCQAGRG